MTDPHSDSQGRWAKMERWCWRVRRDVLALEFVSTSGGNGWRELKVLFEEKYPDEPHPLPPEELLDTTKTKVALLLSRLPYPDAQGDPGDPPIPPE